MFELFETRVDPKVVQRLTLSVGGSLAVTAAALAILIAFSGDSTPAPPKEAPIEVVFKPPPPPPPPPPLPAKPEPPPPPPPPQKQPPKVVKSAPPKVARATPPPRPALVAPTEVPLEKPLEQEPVADPAPIEQEEPTDEIEGSGEYAGRVVDANATAAAPPSPPAPKPVHLPEDGVPPVALPSNTPPEFPPEARAKGLEGMVILRLVVTAAGEVSKVELLKGSEPFSSAALAAVKTWRYQPALSGGQPIAVFQTLRIPFRLRN